MVNSGLKGRKIKKRETMVADFMKYRVTNGEKSSQFRIMEYYKRKRNINSIQNEKIKFQQTVSWGFKVRI